MTSRRWEFFDNHQRDAAANSYSFWNNDPFTQDQVYVAYGLPYPLGRAVTHTQSIKSSPWVTPTAVRQRKSGHWPVPGRDG